MQDSRANFVLQTDNPENAHPCLEAHWSINDAGIKSLAEAKCTKPQVLVAYCTGRAVEKYKDKAGTKMAVAWQERVETANLYRGFCCLCFEEAGPHRILAFVLWNEVGNEAELRAKIRSKDFGLFDFFAENKHIKTGVLGGQGIGHASFFADLTVDVGFKYFNRPVWLVFLDKAHRLFVCFCKKVVASFMPPKSVYLHQDEDRYIPLSKTTGA